MKTEELRHAGQMEEDTDMAETMTGTQTAAPVKVTKDMTIGEIINIDINLAGVLMGGGMYCVGCPASQGESLEEAAAVHGIDPDLLLERLNAYLAAQAE